MSETETAKEVREIVGSIRQLERNLRQKLGFLKYQNAIGAGIFIVSILAIVGLSSIYILYSQTDLITGSILPTTGMAESSIVSSSGLSILIVASIIVAITFFLSFLHELEHDLIHSLYFPGETALHRFLYHSMMLGVWLFRPNIISPWYRKKIHILHHKVSGTPEDLEERLIGNGMPYGFKRLAAMADGFLSVTLRQKELRQIPAYNAQEFLLATFPMVTLYYTAMIGWVATLLFSDSIALLSVLAPYFQIAMVVWVAPNMLRQFSINLISSSMHYYGNVNSLREQTQILDPIYLKPFQWLTCYFGRTHTIHHYVINQPFYIRTMIADRANAILLKSGIRYNDTGTFFRANRLAA